MAIPVIDFSNLNGEERAKTMTQIANGCEEWGFFQVSTDSYRTNKVCCIIYVNFDEVLVLIYMVQLVNHGVPEELMARVKKVCSEFYKLEREEGFKNSKLNTLLHELVENKSGETLENVDWEDVITLLDDNEWPSKTPGFK